MSKAQNKLNEARRKNIKDIEKQEAIKQAIRNRALTRKAKNIVFNENRKTARLEQNLEKVRRLGSSGSLGTGSSGLNLQPISSTSSSTSTPPASQVSDNKIYQELGSQSQNTIYKEVPNKPVDYEIPNYSSKYNQKIYEQPESQTGSKVEEQIYQELPPPKPVDYEIPKSKSSVNQKIYKQSESNKKQIYQELPPKPVVYEMSKPVSQSVSTVEEKIYNNLPFKSNPNINNKYKNIVQKLKTSTSLYDHYEETKKMLATMANAILLLPESKNRDILMTEYMKGKELFEIEKSQRIGGKPLSDFHTQYIYDKQKELMNYIQQATNKANKAKLIPFNRSEIKKTKNK